MSSNVVAPQPRIVIFLDSQAGFPLAADLRKGVDDSVCVIYLFASLLFTMHTLRSRYICAFHLSLLNRNTRLIGQTSVLAFYWSSSPVDAAKVWETFAKKQEYVQAYHSKNIKIMVSVGGGSVKPTTDKWDAKVSAQKVVQFVKTNLLDGVDLDWEVCLLHGCAKPHIYSKAFLLA
jgi:hypothetical protein